MVRGFVMSGISSTAFRCVCLCSLVGLQACSLGYYFQAAAGQMRLMSDDEPVEKLLEERGTDPILRERLELSRKVLEFAQNEMLLPDNGSYTSYVDIGRPYVVWNVFAADEFSLESHTWCFPVVGCVAYRGYFDEDRARRFAEKIDAKDADVFVGGVRAYSTLGRFRDPLLSTMVDMDELQFTGLLIHELAHQRLYVQDDTYFNEGFATAVEHEGIRRWLEGRGEADRYRDWRLELERRAQVRELLAGAREELTAVYAGKLSPYDRRIAKERVFDELREDYRRVRAGWSGPAPFAGWFGGSLNNASLVALAAYDDYVPAFLALMASLDHDLERFYARAEALAALPADERARTLKASLQSGRGHVSDRLSAHE